MEKHGTYFNLFTKQQKFYKSSEKDLTLDSISEMPETYEGAEEEDEAEDDDVPLNDIAGIEPDPGSDLVSPDEVIREIAENERDDFRNYPWRKLVKINLPDLPLLSLATASCVIMASMTSVGSQVFMRNKFPDKVEPNSTQFSMSLIGVGVVSGWAMFFQILLFAGSLERLTDRLRRKLFESYLRQDMDWLEKPVNSTGSLSCLLFKDSFLLETMAGAKSALLLQSFLGIFIAASVSMLHHFFLGFVASIFILVVLFTVYALKKIAKESDRQVTWNTKRTLKYILSGKREFCASLQADH